ncbi:MAG: Txe/YoeB family addiction module toxin [bacterium]
MKYWQKTSKNTFQKCLDILKQLETEPTNLQTVGKPEWLKGNFTGCISRRITKADRCVYEVLEKQKTIKVLQMRFHYDEH